MSLMSIFLGKKKNERETMLSDYAVIMSRNDNPLKGDEDKLEQLMRDLGLTIAQVESDITQFREMTSYKATVDTEGVVSTNLAAAKETLATADAAYKTALNARTVASRAVGELDAAQYSINYCKKLITDMQHKNPRLAGKDWK